MSAHEILKWTAIITCSLLALIIVVGFVGNPFNRGK